MVTWKQISYFFFFMLACIFFSPKTTLGKTIMSDAFQNIIIELKLLKGEDLAVIYGGDDKINSRGVYIMGTAQNGNPDSVFIKLEISSPNNPTIRAKNINVGWIPPNKTSKVYFLVYLMQPPLKTKLSEVQLNYKIVSVTQK